jgi:glyoxylase-like metal-dependent hydrolase (beta-lactamase superfamily II)
MCQPLLQRPYDVEQVCQVVRALYGGRVNFNEGECAIAPGIGAHHVGGHAPGLQVVTVRTRRGVVVLASDALHFYENLTRDNPVSVVVDVPDYLRAFGTLARLAASPEHIVPGHDPLVLRLYPPASDAWAGEAVRLDAMPSQPTPLAGLSHR